MIHRQPVQPRAEPCCALEGAELLPRPNKDLLGQILGPVLTHHSTRQGINPPYVAAVETLKRFVVSVCGPLNVVRFGVRGHQLTISSFV